MKQFFQKIKIIKSKQKETYFAVEKKEQSKSMWLSLIIMLMIILPIFIIFFELFKQFSLILPFTYFLLVLIALICALVLPLYTVIYFEMLKNNVENEEINTIKASEIYLCEIVNPTYLIFGIIISTLVFIVLYIG